MIARIVQEFMRFATSNKIKELTELNGNLKSELRNKCHNYYIILFISG